MVDDQPARSQEENDGLRQESREAERIDLQRADGAHRAGRPPDAPATTDDQWVVAGQDHRPAGRGRLLENGHEFHRQRRVEVGGRLVGDDHMRVVDRRPGDGDTLLLAAREVLNGRSSAMRQAQVGEQSLGTGVPGAPVAAERVGLRHDVFLRRKALDQIELLEHEATRADHRAPPPYLGLTR